MDSFNHIGSTHFAALRGIEMAYADAGTGDAIVLLHGFLQPIDVESEIDFLVNNGLRVVSRPTLPASANQVGRVKSLRWKSWRATALRSLMIEN